VGTNFRITIVWRWVGGRRAGSELASGLENETFERSQTWLVIY